jgi:hypothetical protein
VRDKDPERFKLFVEECLVGSLDSTNLGPFDVLEVEDRSIGMAEVSSVLLLSLQRSDDGRELTET